MLGCAPASLHPTYKLSTILSQVCHPGRQRRISPPKRAAPSQAQDNQPSVSVSNVRDQDERGRSSLIIVLNNLAYGADILPDLSTGKLAVWTVASLVFIRFFW